ncbi:class II histocompatibility antigen, B-L beta chain-like, partial [Acridotheres tristis]
MTKFECHFINGTEKVRYLERYIYNRVEWARFDSDVGLYEGFTPAGEEQAWYWNSDPAEMEYRRNEVNRLCRHNYEVFTPFLVERRVPPSVSISLVPSSSQPGPGRLLCSVMDFYPAQIQVRWFQGQQELSEHVVATDVVANGDWTYQLLVLLESPARRGVTYTCQVEHVSLEQPLRQHWEMPPDAARSKMLTGIGGFVLGLVFVALGLGFYVRKKCGPSGCFGAGGSCPALAMGASGGSWGRYVQRRIYNREEYARFDSDVGLYEGLTPYGEKQARHWNSDPKLMEDRRTAVDWFCRCHYKSYAPFSVERRVPPSVSISLVPSSSQPGPGRLLCSVMDFYPAQIQVRWFQGQQELSEHVVATDVVANGDWTYQLLVLLESPARRGVTYTCQVEHVSLEQPLRQHWEMPPDAA